MDVYYTKRKVFRHPGKFFVVKKCCLCSGDARVPIKFEIKDQPKEWPGQPPSYGSENASGLVVHPRCTD